MLAQDEQLAATADMRARFRMVSEQIASELVALSARAEQMPSSARDAVLSAAAQIAKTQEGLCDETARTPIALELRLGLMQDLLEGLLHVGGIVKEQVQCGLDPEVMVRFQIARAQIALLNRVRQDLQGQVSDTLFARLTHDLQKPVSDHALYSQGFVDAPIPGTGSIAVGTPRKGVVWERRSTVTLAKQIASLSLTVVAAGAGFVANYFNLSSAGIQPESAPKQVGLPRPTMVTPLPADTPASTEPSPSMIPAAPSASASSSMEPSFKTQAPLTQLEPPAANVDASVRSSRAPTDEGSATGSPEVGAAGNAAAPSGQHLQTRTPIAGSGAVDTAAADGFVPVVFTHKDQASAARAFADLQQRYPALLKHRQSEVQPVEIKNKGTWHRLVVLPVGTRQQADALCAQLTASGYDRCWVKAY